MARNLIVGIGNPILSDDGIGPKVVRELEKKLNPADFSFFTDFLLSLETLHVMNGYKNLFFIDGCRTGKKKPGELSFLSIDHYEQTLHLNNYHDISIKTLIDLYYQINGNQSVNIYIIAVEIIEDKLFSEKLSEPVDDKFDLIIVQSIGYIEQVLRFQPIT